MFRAKRSLVWISKPVKAYSKRPFKAYSDLVGAEEGGGRKGLLDQMLLLEVAHRLQVPLSPRSTFLVKFLFKFLVQFLVNFR